MPVCHDADCPFYDEKGGFCRVCAEYDECPMADDEPRNDVVGNERMLYGDDD